MSPPKWDGQFKNFYSWRIQFELYLKSATIDIDEDQLMFLLHTSVLLPRVTSSIQSCTTVTRTVEILRAETEARERIAPTMIKPEAKWRSPSLNHFTGAGPSTTVRHQTSTANMVYSDPCMLGCVVHHKFVDFSDNNIGSAAKQ